MHSIYLRVVSAVFRRAELKPACILLLAGGEGGGGDGGRDEVWDRETMFSQLAKRSPCVMVSG